jgi:hypothetical protein
MSRSTTQTFNCACGTEFTGQVYEYINTADDPQLRYVILAGLINVSTCPNCGRKMAVSTPFIYSDPAYNLLIYVHPRADTPDEARQLILEKLRSVYLDINKLKDQPDASLQKSAESGDRTIDLTHSQATELPPLKIVFGLEQFSELLNSVLGPEDKLGRLALNTQSSSAAERAQFYTITKKLATEMNCFIDVEDTPEEYTVWVYGSRRQIGALMRELAPRG